MTTHQLLLLFLKGKKIKSERFRAELRKILEDWRAKSIELEKQRASAYETSDVLHDFLEQQAEIGLDDTILKIENLIEELLGEEK